MWCAKRTPCILFIKLYKGMLIMRILYDSTNQIHKTPFGCLKQDETCIISIHVPSSCKTIRSFLCFEREDGFYTEFEMKKASSENSYDIFSTEFSLSECGLYFYYFKIPCPYWHISFWIKILIICMTCNYWHTHHIFKKIHFFIQ